MANKILITGALKLTDLLRGQIEALGLEILFVQNELEPLSMDVSDVEMVICNGLFLHNDISKFTSLKYIQVTSAGLDRLPLKEIEERGITINNARGVYSIPMAEWAICGVLSLYKYTREFFVSQGRREWKKNRDIIELYNKRALVVGYGSVGYEVSKRLHGLGVHVGAVDITNIESEYVSDSYTISNLGAVVGEYDIVVLTLPLTEATRHLFNGDMFAKMKADSILINISRGAVVDEQALIVALKKNRLQGAALDVFEEEPLSVDSPLWDMDSVIITPHNSFVSACNQQRLESLIIENLIKYRNAK